LASEITKQDQSRENWTICWDATPPEAQPTSHQNHSPATTLSRSCGWEDPKSTKCHFQFSRTHFQGSLFSRTSFELGEHLIPCWKVDIYMAVCQNLVPLVNIKIAGKWMFIPLKMVCIGIDP
jgi:hypothetical protein